MTTRNTPGAKSLAASVGFDLLGDGLGCDVERAFSAALEAGAVFPVGGDALVIFQNTFAASIRDIEEGDRGRLFKRFLRAGPYEEDGPIPPELQGKRLSQTECAAAITFIRNPQGRREMLWPQNLDEIALNSRTASDCRIAGDERATA